MAELPFISSDISVNQMGILEAVVNSINTCPEETFLQTFLPFYKPFYKPSREAP